jgi:hypothetical protein
MKLDRNINADGRGKYALLKMREVERFATDDPFYPIQKDIAAAIKLLEDEGILDWGTAGTEREFFVIRLKDRYAGAALAAYAASIREADPEFAAEVDDLVARAGPRSAFCKEPD